MAFAITTVVKGMVVEMTLTGDLDAIAAPRFQSELESIAGHKPSQLVLRMRDLAFLASAGIRMLIFAKQKMGAGVSIYVIAPQQMVLATLQHTGIHQSVIIQDEFPVAS